MEGPAICGVCRFLRTGTPDGGKEAIASHHEVASARCQSKAPDTTNTHGEHPLMRTRRTALHGCNVPRHQRLRERLLLCSDFEKG
jgi:hypothetical protein